MKLTKEDLKAIIKETIVEELAMRNKLEEGGAMSGGYAQSGSLDTAKRAGGYTSKLNFKALDGKKTKKVLAKDIKPGMVTNTGKVMKVTDIGWQHGKRCVEVGYGGIGNQGSYASDCVPVDHEYDVLDEALEEDYSQVFEGLY